MYAANLFRVFCSYRSILSRPLLFRRHCLKSNRSFVHILNKTTQFESNVLYSKNLIRISFGTHCSPDDNHNVSNDKASKKRRRIKSISSSDEEENTSPSTADNVK